MVNVKLYFDVNTQEWVIENPKKDNPCDLKDILESIYREPVEVVYGGFTNKTKEEESKTIRINGVELPYIENYDYVTGSEAETRLRKGEELHSVDLKYGLKLVWSEGLGRLHSNRHGKYVDSGYTMREVRTQFWLVSN
ncbi:hypothetical protein COF68_06340 [Bacillus toyonensis]|uniref:hypothetical protein n=1 Tax=Bacillus toyonensis TaxID=155322 RepID=UPI000BFB898F|nr:hypothetical protein [Bacillus toyonensis]PHE64453.1 hypothetical protein COF68_06340 [Bacillus toyonensis]